MANAFDSFAKGLQVGQEVFHEKPQLMRMRQQAMDQQKTLFDQQQTDRTNLKDAWQTVGDKAWDAVDSPMARVDIVRRAHRIMTTEDMNVARTEGMELFNSSFWGDWRKEHGITGKILNMGFDEANDSVWLVYEKPDGSQGGFTVPSGTFEADFMREVSRLGDPEALQSAGRATLVNRESGGRWDAQNNAVGHGGQAGHFGRVQFGHARLLDAKRAGVLPHDMTPEQFMASPELQRKAEEWHFADIDRFIAQRDLEKYDGTMIRGVPVTYQGMVNAAHLGGRGGLAQFLRTGGAYDPADENGTRLSDYMRMGAESSRPPSAMAQLEEIKAKEDQAAMIAVRQQREGLQAATEQLEPQIAQAAAEVRRAEAGLTATFEAQKTSNRTPEETAAHARAVNEVNQARAGLAALQEQQGVVQQQSEELEASEVERHAAEEAEKRAGLEEQAAAEAEAAREAATGTPKGFAGRLGEMFSPKRIMERAEARGGDMYEVEPLRPDASLPQYPPQWMQDFREGQGRPIELDPIVVQGTPEPEVPAAAPEAPAAEPAAPSATPAGLGTQTQAPRTLQNNPQLVQGMVDRLRAAQAPGGLGGSGPLAGRSAAVQERERKALVELAFQGVINAQQFENYIRTGSFAGDAKGADRKIQHIKDGIVYDSAYGGYIDVAELMGRPKEELAPKDLRQRLQLESDTWDMAWDVVGLPKAMRDGPMAASFRHDFNVMAESMGFEPLQFLLGNLDSGDGKQGSQALLASVYRNHRWIKENSGSTWYKPWTYFNQLNVNSTTIAYQMSMHGYVNNEKEGLNRIRQDYYDPLQQEYKNWAAKDERPRRMSEAQTAAYSTAISDMVLRGGKSLDEARQEVFMIGRESGWNPDAVNSYLSRGR